jgi:hypothetical protein
MFKNYKKERKSETISKISFRLQTKQKGMVKYGYIPLLCIFYDKARGINIGYCWD